MCPCTLSNGVYFERLSVRLYARAKHSCQNCSIHWASVLRRVNESVCVLVCVRTEVSAPCVCVIV